MLCKCHWIVLYTYCAFYSILFKGAVFLPDTRAWKRGFSCPAGRLRLATGRVQTAEWTNGHAVRYL